MDKQPKEKLPEKTAEKKTVQLPGLTFGIAGAHPRMGALIFTVLIPAIGLFAYSNTFQAPFQWDELTYIGENVAVRDLSYFLETSKASGLETYSALKSRYIGYLTFALNYRIHGLDVTGYHIVNFAVHLINTLLVYLLAILTFRTPFLTGSPLSPHSKLVASLSAMLFISHPVQTEAVTYIFQRLASLATMFYLLSLVCYIKYRIQESEFRSQNKEGHILNSVFWILFSVLFAVLAMKTKENAFTLPFIAALYEFSFFRGSVKSRLLRLFPLLLTLCIIPLSLASWESFGRLDIIPRGYPEISRSEYLITQFRVVVTYIRLLFLPIDQNIDYDYPLFDSFFAAPVILSLMFIVSLFGLAAYLFRKSASSDPDLRILSFGILWFFITLSIESGIVPIPMVICEYRIYLPSVGIFLGVTTAALQTIGRLGNGKVRIASLLFFFLIPFVFSFASYARNSIWENETALWEDVVAKSPANARAHNNLGYIFYNKGMMDEAIDHYRTALSLNPRAAEVYNNLGNAYRVKGFTDMAMKQYLIALEIEPANAKAYNNLGVIYEDRKMTDTAIRYYRIASEISPENADIHYNLGMAYFSTGLKETAVEQLRQAAELNPNHIEAKKKLAEIYGAATP